MIKRFANSTLLRPRLTGPTSFMRSHGILGVASGCVSQYDSSLVQLRIALVSARNHDSIALRAITTRSIASESTRFLRSVMHGTVSLGSRSASTTSRSRLALSFLSKLANPIPLVVPFSNCRCPPATTTGSTSFSSCLSSQRRKVSLSTSTFSECPSTTKPTLTTARRHSASWTAKRPPVPRPGGLLARGCPSWPASCEFGQPSCPLRPTLQAAASARWIRCG